MRLGNAVLTVGPGEPAVQALGTHLLRDGVRIAPATRRLDRALADVGAEEADSDVLAPVLQQFVQHDGQRIDLLAGRAAGDPAAQGVAGLCEDPRQYRLPQCIERRRFAEEAGDVDQHVLVQRVDLGRLFREQLEITLDVAAACSVPSGAGYGALSCPACSG
jgi:hypothetical protein